MINNWLGNFAVGSTSAPVDRWEHPLSRPIERQTKNYVGYHNY